MPYEASQWLDSLPEQTFFRTADVPGESRNAVRVWLSSSVRRDPPPVMRAAPNLYWKPGAPNMFTGKPDGPSWGQIGWEIAGPHAAACGWWGANIVGWSTQIALQYLTFAVPGEPTQRHPHPRVTIRGRRNLARRQLTRLEATHLEAVVAFDDGFIEMDWDEALVHTHASLRMDMARGTPLVRSEVLEPVADSERPNRRPAVFRSRMRDLVDVIAEAEHEQAEQHQDRSLAAA